MKKILFVLSFLVVSNLLAQSPIPSGAVVEKLCTGFLQPEGPVWKDSVLLFSDIKANKIYSWKPKDSTLSVYMYPSDSSNGLTLDKEGRLVLTQMAKRRVSRREFDGNIKVLASTYLGKKFNSPNDLVVKSDGSIFFTDPDFNTPVGQTKEMGFKGVFRISPYGVVYALDSTTFDKPNGICFSPDEKKLYVNESPKRIIYVWDVVNDSTISNKRKLYTIPGTDYVNYADGMKVDNAGNIYCTGPGGVWIISPSGSYIDKISTPENPSNCAWGDGDRKTLYITAGSSLYRIRLSSVGVERNHGQNIEYNFNLLQNFPNPFNPVTTIKYEIGNTFPSTQIDLTNPTPIRDRINYVSLRVYNMLGQEVATLVNEPKPAGKYEVRFDASNLPSGVYLYQLKADNLVATQKLVVIK